MLLWCLVLSTVVLQVAVLAALHSKSFVMTAITKSRPVAHDHDACVWWWDACYVGAAAITVHGSGWCTLEWWALRNKHGTLG